MRWANGVSVLLMLWACGQRDSERKPREISVKLVGRFGSADSSLSLRFIGSIALSHGKGDTLLLTQFQVPGILMLSSSGDSLGMIGRSGSGPGEFSAPFAPTILNDTIWVPDLGGKIARFRPDGSFIDEFRLAIPPLGPYQIRPSFVSPLMDGTLLYRGVAGTYEEAHGQVPARAFIRVDRSGAIRDTVALEQVRLGAFVLRFPSGGGITGSHPLANSDVTGVDPLGRWIVAVEQQLEQPGPFGFIARWISPVGDTLADDTVQTKRVDAGRARADWVEQLVTHDGLRRAEAEASVADVPFPDVRAPAEAVFADEDGRAWVRSPTEMPDSARWYVLSQEHGLLGSFTLPKRVVLLAAKGDVIWGWSPGPYDEPYVLKFRATW